MLQSSIPGIEEPTPVSCDFDISNDYSYCRSMNGPAKAKAARVSYGSDVGLMRKMNLSSHDMVRDETCAVTVTVQFYFVVPEGHPIDETDIRKAVDVCEEAYKGCVWDGHLMDKVPETVPLKDSPIVKTSMVETDTFPDPSSTEALLRTGFHSLTNKKWEGLLLDSLIPSHLKPLAANKVSFNYLHNNLALPLLNSRMDLDKAFCALQKANEMHILYAGVPAEFALYNMACCLSIAAEMQEKSTGSAIVAPYLPPNPSMEMVHQCDGQIESLILKRLDSAANWLIQATVAGYKNKFHMQTDNDLSFLRQRRPELVATAFSLM